MKKPIALLMAAAMVMSMAACGSDDAQSSTPSSSTPSSSTPSSSVASSSSTPASSDAASSSAASSSAVEEKPVYDVVKFDGNYTYQDSVSTLCANWNPHTYQTTDDAYLADFIRSGFYEFVFNDEVNYVEGKDPFTGYKIIPLMAASEPVDVTEAVKASHPQYNIPESATEGFAYTIDLNPNAVWEDGTPINADSYVYSMQQLLDSSKKNYRAADYYSGDLVIAGAEEYANSGLTIKKANSADAENMDYAVADLVKGEDGTYATADGAKVYFGLNETYAWVGRTLSYYSSYFPEGVFDALTAMADKDGWIPVTDESMAKLYEFTGSGTWGNEPWEQLGYYMSYEYSYPTVDYSTVGVFKSGDYQITIVFAQSLKGFNLLYNLTSNWLVKEDIYEATQKYDGDAYSTTYNTSVETTSSYGPYKLVEFQQDKALKLVKNDKWVGWTDGQHVYQDPVDGQFYEMYQTTTIECEVVAEAATRKMMFLKGELMGYGLQAEDFATYRSSEYCYATPGSTIFFLILNGHLQAIQDRENAENFDKATQDLETLTVESFRKAFAVTYDKDLFAATISPARSGGFGVIGGAYVYDPESGSLYRDTDQAKQVLCDFYSVDVSKFSSLDEAVDSITGYDPVKAKELFNQAYADSLAAGYITDADADGKCDQMISIEYCLSADSDFMTKTVDYLNEKMNEVIAGTPFEGKIQFVKSAPYGGDWSNKIRAGLSDTVLGGWSGSLLNPFSLTDLYVNPDKMYDAAWFNAEKVRMGLDINGQKVAMNLRQWSDALNGTTVKVGDKEYNFGEGVVPTEDRLTILAAIEGKVLGTYNYIPMLQDGGMSLLSQQVFYVIEDYNPVLGRGGIQYMKYNYTDEEWAAYVSSQGGELKY